MSIISKLESRDNQQSDKHIPTLTHQKIVHRKQFFYVLHIQYTLQNAYCENVLMILVVNSQNLPYGVRKIYAVLFLIIGVYNFFSFASCHLLSIVVITAQI